MRTISVLGGALVLAVVIVRCGGGGSTVSNSSKLMSTSLGSRAAIACSASVTNCTPSNLQGRVFAAGAMLGGQGADGYNMTFLADSAAVIQDPSQTSHPQGTLTFNLLTPSVFSGKISIPDEKSMPADPAITSISTYFDFLDATFTLSGTSVNGTYTIRTVFRKTATTTASDLTTGETMKVGDKLIKTSSDTVFRWCTSAGCVNPTRPASPLQDALVVDSEASNDSNQGNKDYALYDIDLKSSVTVTHAQLADTTRLWTVDYDVTKAIGFSALPSTFTSEKDIVSAFKLEFECNSGGSNCSNNDNRIKATLTIGEPGSAS